jgi:toxin-antitoxin system PIN domain toxin
VSRPRPALLDVNVLIALFDADHIHHDIAHDWFAENRRHRWATCALTQNGFLRVLTNVRSGVESDQATIFASLRTLCSAKDHVFWQNSVSLLDESVFDSDVLVSHHHITDIYLLALAVKMRGRVATFDKHIPVRAVRGATAECVVVLGQ